jgi:hypothetical protein
MKNAEMMIKIEPIGGRKDKFFLRLRGLLGCVSNDENRKFLQHVMVDEKGVMNATDGRKCRSISMLDRFPKFDAGLYAIEMNTAKKIILRWADYSAGRYPNVEQIKGRSDKMLHTENRLSDERTVGLNLFNLFADISSGGGLVDPAMLKLAIKGMENPVLFQDDPMSVIYIKGADNDEAWVMPLRVS